MTREEGNIKERTKTFVKVDLRLMMDKESKCERRENKIRTEEEKGKGKTSNRTRVE